MRSVALVILAATALLPLGTFTLDPARSQVEFFVRDNRGGFTGEAHAVEVKAAVHESEDSFRADVEVRIDARRITTGVGVRDTQMRRDFLQTARFPFIIFKGTAVPRGRPGALPFPAVLRGTLTIRDVTREVEIPARVTALADAYLAEGQVTLRMSDFGIPIPRFLIFVAEDPVLVKFKVRLH